MKWSKIKSLRMVQSTESVLKALEKGVYEPLYFVQGEETYYIDAIAQHIEEKVLKPEEKSFNLSIFYGKECTMTALLTQARRFPMVSSKQVILVKEAQEMADLKNAIGQQRLAHYLQRPQPATILVFAYKYKTIDARTVFGKALAANAVLVTCKKPYDHQLPAFIRTAVEKFGRSITEKAIWMLQECVGNDLTRISHELQKLRINLSAGSTITETMVEAYIGMHKPFNVFELQQAIMKKEYAKSYQIAQVCALNSKEPTALPIVTVLYAFFSKLLVLHQTKETTPAKLAQQISVHPYFVQGYLDAIKRYPLHQTLRNMTHLHEADLHAKGIGSNASDDQIIKELIFKIMHDI